MAGAAPAPGRTLGCREVLWPRVGFSPVGGTALSLAKRPGVARSPSRREVPVLAASARSPCGYPAIKPRSAAPQLLK